MRLTSIIAPRDIRITVVGNGLGFPASIEVQLFKPFARSTKMHDAGLGLAIAAEITRAHGGQIALR